MPATKKMLDDLALSDGEYEAIVERLGREPNDLELGLFGSLWSEHCGYKHSKPLLRKFSASSPRVLVAPGEENAGVVDIGDGLAIVMKIESHNHPSAIEPYQGAATGVGGIVLSSKLASGDPKRGMMYELEVIAAVVVGGTSLMGGEGRILGTLIGAFIIAVIKNGMNLLNVGAWEQQVILGAVLLSAVLLDNLKRHRSGSG